VTKVAEGDRVDDRRGVMRERVIGKDCESCGQRFRPRTSGRPARFCSQSCRQRAWALRQAQAALQRGDARPEVVGEVVEPLVPVSGPISVVPSTAREWSELLEQLAVQLSDRESDLARRHYDHRRLYQGLLAALTALSEATPGGLENLVMRR
jgi:hypothetical protein